MLVSFQCPKATPLLVLLVRGWQTFSVKGQTVNFFGFVGHLITTTQLWGGGAKSSRRQYVNKWKWLRFNKALFLDTEI